MKKRVQELVEAATVLSGAGDREGALRLVDEALRLAPEDRAAKAFREQLSPGPTSPTPFAPPPADLFGGAPRPAANPFVRPDPPVGPAAGKGIPDLEKLLLDAAGALHPPSKPTDPAGVSRGPSRATLMFGGDAAAPPEPSAAVPLPGRAREPGAVPLPGKAQEPEQVPLPSSGTLPYAQRPEPVALPASSGTLHFAQRPDEVPEAAEGAVPPSSTIPFGSRPARPGSDPAASRSGTLVAGEATSSAVAPVDSPKRPPSAPNSARTGTMLSGGRGARPKTGARAPSKKSQASAAASSRPASSAPYDPMELIDAPPSSQQGEARIADALKGARQLLEFADHSGALTLVEQVLAESPLHAEALALKARCEATLTSMFESKLGDLSRRPRLRLRPDEVIWLNLDHRAGFVLAQIDGQVSLEDIFDLSGMGRLDTAKILAQLVEEKVIQL